jgi:hypothetical protein
LAEESPVAAITTATSEKADKRFANRRHRHGNRQILKTAEDEPQSLDRKQTGDPWDMAKDGKARFNPAERPKRLRK